MKRKKKGLKKKDDDDMWVALRKSWFGLGLEYNFCTQTETWHNHQPKMKTYMFVVRLLLFLGSG